MNRSAERTRWVWRRREKRRVLLLLLLQKKYTYIYVLRCMLSCR